jgi:hypothetical protein
MANQDRRPHAPGKPKRGKSFRDPRENRKFSRSQDENPDRPKSRYGGKPQPGKPTRPHSVLDRNLAIPKKTKLTALSDAIQVSRS